MVLKKSQLYSSLWKSCDELRGGMDASQYKDYILTLLFVKYVSDKQKADPDSLIDVPVGGSFDDMLVLKGKTNIGEGIDKIIGKLAEANDLVNVIDVASFNDEEKLGRGKEMVDRLSKLVTIFADLDFRGSRAEGDDLLGDAYEYLMRHFATESGKSKGQFYTPAEVSRVLAKIVGISPKTRQDQTVYDPTCGSGSLLLKVADEAPRGITIYGQEKDNATWALSKMNMILHGNEDADIRKGDTITNPQFTNGTELRTFDFAVANPPFSVKSWSNGLENDYGRFAYGRPPEKNGDYAFLLHVLKSLKSTGKAAVILPHGVLFRGNAETLIRRRLLDHGFIKGIIGLPPNLFYGTGIPACIVVLDKEHAQARTGVFMIDASKGFIKDGNKNRLRSQDIHKIVDTFNRQIEIERYARLVPLAEIADTKNDYNLNIPRYIDSSEPEDIQDLHAHLHGGIPNRDLDALSDYWDAFPSLRVSLFIANRPGYSDLAIDTTQAHPTVLESEEFKQFSTTVREQVADWFASHRGTLAAIGPDTRPNDLITRLGDDLLDRFKSTPLLDPCDVYEQLLTYWQETMHDDVALIMADGWCTAARPRKTIEDKERKLAETPDLVIGSGKTAAKYKMDLIPPKLIVARYFADQQRQVDELIVQAEESTRAVEEYTDEHAVEEGLLAAAMDDDKISKASVAARLKDARREGTDPEEVEALQHLIKLYDAEAAAKKAAKEAQALLDMATLKKYIDLSEVDVKTLLLDDKWHFSIATRVASEVNALTLALIGSIQQLGENYAETLVELERQTAILDEKVASRINDPVYGSSDWPVVRLGDVAKFSKGYGLSKSDMNDEGVDPCVHYGELFTKYGAVISDVRGRTSHPNLLVRSRKGDVLMPTSDVTPRGLAKASAILLDNVVLGGDILVIRPTRKILHGPYLANVIRRDENQVLSLVRGSTVYHLYAADMRNFSFVMPPLDEQIRIAERLIEADSMIDSHARLVAKKQLIKQGMLQRLPTSTGHDLLKERPI